MEETNTQNQSSCSHSDGACHHRCGHARLKALKFILPFIFILAVLVWLDASFHMFSATNANKITAHKIQAVFLSNGQVYFGNLSQNGFNSWKLTNAYYLEKSQALEESAAQTKLIKLTQDLHQPENTMYISGKNILFWQNLQNTSPVTRAIISGK